MTNHQINKTPTTTRAFTLLEMLLVIAIIAILAGIVIIAINPGRQLASARNAQRASDLRALHSAVQQYYIDNHVYPDKLNGNLQEICATEGATGCVDLKSALVPTYISAIPTDPQAVGTSTLYKIAINQKSKTPELIAERSLEYDMVPVQIGTKVLVQTVGGKVPVKPCGDPAKAECWSTSAETMAWSTDTLKLAGGFYSNDEEIAEVDMGGKFNHDEIINGYWDKKLWDDAGSNYPAFAYCEKLNDNGHDDWYLPSLGQLRTGLTDWDGLDFEDDTFYWSSTEFSASFAWYAVYDSVDKGVGRNIDDKNGDYNFVRCLR